jgi:hypothetical protein
VPIVGSPTAGNPFEVRAGRIQLIEQLLGYPVRPTVVAGDTARLVELLEGSVDVIGQRRLGCWALVATKAHLTAH